MDDDVWIHLIQFTIFVISISPNLCICLFTEPDTTYKRGRSFFIFKPQFERESITNNATPFLYCAEICPSVYVQSIYRNSIPKGNCILKRSFPAIRSIKIETESSIKKLSNVNFQWTKALYHNNLNNTAFFLHFSRHGYRYNLLSLVMPKTISHWSPRKWMSKFHKNCENTGKILKISCVI